MFRIEYSENNIERKSIITQDIRDVGQILINIINDEEVENQAMKWCGNATFGDTLKLKKYPVTIKCIYNECFEKPIDNIMAKNLVETLLKNSNITIVNERFNKSGDYIFDIGFGDSEISFSNPTKFIWINLNYSDSTAMDSGLACRSVEQFISVGKKYINANIDRYPFEVHSTFSKIADKITLKTGLKHTELKFNDDGIYIDFPFEKSRMQCVRGNNLYFSITDDTGKIIWNIMTSNTAHFINEVSNVLLSYSGRNITKHNVNNYKTDKTYNMTNKEIVIAIRNAKNQCKECTFTMYDNGVWKINIERHPYGQIRFWVSREDKLGNYQSSLCTPYMYNGEIKYSAEFKLTTAVVNKLLSTYRTLLKAGLIE